MRIGIVGASAAGLYCAILLKLEQPSCEITVFEKNNKIGKKIAATGNGRCNILNKKFSPCMLNNSSWVAKALGDIDYQTLKNTLDEIGIPTLEEDDLIYPYSLSSKNVIEILNTKCQLMGIKIVLGTMVTDYKETTLFFNEKQERFDKLVFAVGGKSQKNLGSDGNFFPVLKAHGYFIKELIPALCPIIVEEKTKWLSGYRHKANVKVFELNKKIFEEDGEILFKDNGLSGIVIFNASRVLANKQNCSLKIDLFPELQKDELIQLILNLKNRLGNKWILGLLNSNFEKILSSKSVEECASILKEIQFKYVSNYSFEDSQITIGGISLENLKFSLESKIEKNIYFVGEVVDVDGPCGGFNLGWCLASALIVKKGILLSKK